MSQINDYVSEIQVDSIRGNESITSYPYHSSVYNFTQNDVLPQALMSLADNLLQTKFVQFFA